MHMASAQIPSPDPPLVPPLPARSTYTVRSSIVHMLGAVLAEVFGHQDGPEAAGNGGGDERGQASRITSKKHCIMLLLQRVLDKSAYTR